MNVVWNGPLFEPSGYGKAARDYANVLSNFTDVFIDPVTYYIQRKGEFLDIEALPTADLVSDCIHIEHKTPNILMKCREQQRS